MSTWCFALRAYVSYRRISLCLCGLLPVTGCRPSDVQSMLGWQGWSCPRVSYHAFYKKLKNFSCEYDRVNGWNSTLQAAWYQVHQTRSYYVRTIWFERRCACFSYDISSWYKMIVLHTPGLSGRSSKQSSFGYSSTAVWGNKQCGGYVGLSIFT